MSPHVTSAISIEEFRYRIDTLGFCHFENVLDLPLVEELATNTDETIESDLSNSKTLGNYTYMIHAKADSFVQLLELSPLQEFIDEYLGNTCILHSFNAIRALSGNKNPIQNIIHRDTQRFCRPYLLSMQIIYLLDDFTLENGATLVLSGSHLRSEKPDTDYFFTNATPLIGKKGDAVIFDSLLWHCGGLNKTNSNRRAITKVYCRAFMKQQFDYPKITPQNVLAELSDRSLRLLGFDSRPPCSIEEFLLPPESRPYKPGQG